MKKLCFAVLILFFALAVPAYSQMQQNVEQLPAVAIVSHVLGDVQVQLPQQEFRKAYTLDLLPKGTNVRVGPNSKFAVIYLYDRHSEIIRDAAELTVDERMLNGPKELISVDTKKNELGIAEFPRFLSAPLRRSMYADINSPGQAEKEDRFIYSYVLNTSYPPAFYWVDAKQAPYHFQLFNDQNQLVYEKNLQTHNFRYPVSDTSLTKGTQTYYWKVTGADRQVVVPQMPFIILTKFQSSSIAAIEKRLKEADKPNKPYDSILHTNAFLLFADYTSWDKLLKHVSAMSGYEPENPVLYDLMARLYLFKGCPMKSMEAHNKAKSLGSADNILE